MKLKPNPKPFQYSLGTSGENEAAHFLMGKGYQILEKNFRCSLGEIDLIAEKTKRLIFIEVKTRMDHAFGLPEEAVTWQKQNKILRIAQWYLKSKKLSDVPIQFDVIAITRRPGQKHRVRHIPNAFGVSEKDNA